MWKKISSQKISVHKSARRSSQSILKKLDSFIPFIYSFIILWISIGRTDADALILWPPDYKSWLVGKDPDSWKDWRQEEKGTTEDEMVAWHHWLNGHEFEYTARVVMDRVAWRAAVHGVAKSRTRLSNWTDWLTAWEDPAALPLL